MLLAKQVDVSSPSNPVIISQLSYEFTGHYDDAVIDGNYIYHRENIYDSTNSLVHIDSLTQDGQIVGLSDFGMSGEISIDCLAGDRLVLRSAPNYSLYLLDISDKHSVVLTDSIIFDTDSYRSINICGDYLFLTDEQSGSEIIDISESGNFQTQYSSSTPFNYKNPTMRGDTLYTLSTRSDTISFDIYDLSDPSSPQTLCSQYLLPGQMGGPMIIFMWGIGSMAIGPDYAVLHGGFYEREENGESTTFRLIEMGLKTIDLTDLSNLEISTAQRGMVFQMELSDHGLWLWGSPPDLLNVNNSAAPISLGTIDAPPVEFWESVIIEDNLMYILHLLEETDEAASVEIGAYGLDDPLHPDSTGSITLELEHGWGLFVVRNSMVYFFMERFHVYN